MQAFTAIVCTIPALGLREAVCAGNPRVLAEIWLLHGLRKLFEAEISAWKCADRIGDMRQRKK
ncbi:MAG: hypothetical protein V4514_10530 [Pseudomonadota bacterium]|uniref:hypothetical protein n=1 Tax=Phenylobacterium sp. TaxID=1871053 RepID=UPI0025F12FDA|nr:hypothetical protein [Phenylobacterium sp.]MBT9470608.1 hypothetical protein [Phenylobacterium sp.]